MRYLRPEQHKSNVAPPTVTLGIPACKKCISVIVHSCRQHHRHHSLPQWEDCARVPSNQAKLTVTRRMMQTTTIPVAARMRGLAWPCAGGGGALMSDVATQDHTWIDR